MMIIKASAPGTLMLMGEHSVLKGELAIACAVEQRIFVTLKPIEQRELQITSVLGDYQDSLDSIKDNTELRFALQAVRDVADQLPSGLSLVIESEFSHQVGLGSSAAVTVAITAAIDHWLRGAVDKQAVFERSLAAMLSVQGRGSGTDIAASTYGALIAYRVEPVEITPLACVPQIALFYCGYKTPTPEVLARVESEDRRFPELYGQLYRLMGKVTQQAVVAARSQDWPLLGQLMNYYQGLMDSLGVNDRKLADIIYRLRESDGVYGAKISGSGLGDCVISLGELQQLDIPYEQIPVQVDSDGVLVDVIG
ncbi:mevalonate kinase [Motiliproteus sp. MSK22-1]|uniref:mevalonate kinase n=1 Tax=Motiliproteus sp. MSK22-1 TaxID=1897630 RepID=UPI00117C366E|nr:mevalonate kinase [Motiliproteus sp. MSK22-1]